jgi:hypothetical protein
MKMAACTINVAGRRCGSAAIVSAAWAGQYLLTKQRRQCAEGGLR